MLVLPSDVRVERADVEVRDDHVLGGVEPFISAVERLRLYNMSTIYDIQAIFEHAPPIVRTEILRP